MLASVRNRILERPPPPARAPALPGRPRALQVKVRNRTVRNATRPTRQRGGTARRRRRRPPQSPLTYCHRARGRPRPARPSPDGPRRGRAAARAAPARFGPSARPGCRGALQGLAQPGPCGASAPRAGTAPAYRAAVRFAPGRRFSFHVTFTAFRRLVTFKHGRLNAKRNVQRQS